MPSDRQLLSDGEEVLVDTRLHWISLAGPVFVTLIALAGAIAIAVEFPGAPVAVTWVLAAMVALPALWLAGRFLRWRGVRLVVTTGRLIYRRGVLGRDVAQLRLQRIAEVHCTQTLGGRLIGRGRLVLEVTGGDAMVIDDVRRPRALQRLIAGQLDGAWYAPYGGSEVPGGYPAAPGIAGPPASPRSPGRIDGSAGAVPVSPWDVSLPPVSDHTPPHGTGVPASAAAAGPVASPSVPDQLIALDQLRRRGIISAEEFNAKKSELLSRL